MFFLISPKFRMDKILQTPELASKIPPFHRFMLSHVQLFMPAMLVIFAVTLVSAIGLLKRKNWARIVFIALMSLGIAYSLGMLLLLPWFSDELKGGRVVGNSKRHCRLYVSSRLRFPWDWRRYSYGS
jgi:hypothetical protein